MKTRILIAEPSQVIVEGLKAILGKPTRFSLLSPVPNLDDIGEPVSVSARIAGGMQMIMHHPITK